MKSLHRFGKLLILLPIFLFAFVATGATTWYVKTSGNDGSAGTSWGTAYKTIQKALSVASSGDQIWVAAGIYYPDSGSGVTGDDRSSTFSLVAGVAMYGGFNGTESALSQRNWFTYQCILSGDLKQDDAAGFVNNDDNAYHVVRANGANITFATIFDGFYVTGGNGDGGSNNDKRGGGIQCINDASPTINNCTFQSNKTVSVGGGAYSIGGAGNPYFYNCKFAGNQSGDSGGGAAILLSDAVFVNCVFSGNYANYGAGLYGQDDLTFIFAINCTFSGNHASVYGGATRSAESFMTIINSIFWGDKADSSGSVDEIYNSNGGSTAISDCIFPGTCGFNSTTCAGTIINQDPLFVSQPNFGGAPTTAGNLKLLACSPAIDAGNDVSNLTDKDINNAPRKVDAIANAAIIDIGAYEYQNDIDFDNDGYSFCTDCNDNDGTVHTDQLYYVDADLDGFGSTSTAMLCSSTPPSGYATNNTDCDDFDGTVHSNQSYFVDADMDGYGSTTTAMLCSSTPPSGYSTNNTDCNDNDGTVHSNQLYYVDADHDGYGSTTTAMLCSSTAPSGYATNNTDCNDNDGTVHTPLLYFVDSDADGYGSTTSAMLCSSTAPAGYSTNNTDCNDNDGTVHTPLLYYLDGDGDGYGSTTSAMFCSSTAPAGYSTDNTDCNDSDETVYTPQTYYVDGDADGYGSTTSAMICSSTAPAGYSTDNTDCNDSDGTIHHLQLYYIDGDNDGYGSTTTAMLCSLTAPLGYSPNNTDCNDYDGTVHELKLYYVDSDHDGYGSTSSAMFCSSNPPIGYTTNNFDCNDNNAEVHPSAIEVCDDIDNDCDMLYDANDPDYVDNTPPEPVCRTTSVYLDPNGTYTLQPEDVLDFDASFDNCDIITVTAISPAFLSCTQLGQTIDVTVSVADGKDNKTDCTAHITILQGTALPFHWNSTDVGSNANGSSIYEPCTNGGTFTLSAQGYTTNTTDVGHTVFQNVCGDGQIIAHVASLASVGGWAGIQMRETASQGSKKITLKTQLQTILRREIRTTTFGPTNTQMIGITPNHTWLRLVRTGNTFSAYSSIDGESWVFRTAANIPMNTCIMVGLFVESYNNTTTSTATFDHVWVSSNFAGLAGPGAENALATPGSQTPEVRLYPNPTNGKLTLELVGPITTDHPMQWTLFDTQGQTILQGANDNETIDLSPYAAGVYWIRVQTDNTTPVVRKVVKTGVIRP